MIKAEFSKQDIDTIREGIEKLRVETPEAVKDILNQTARDMRAELHKKAYAVYTITKRSFNKSTRIKNATRNKLEAHINISGRKHNAADFRFGPKFFAPGSKMRERPEFYTATIKRENGRKNLVSKHDTKVFYAKMPNGKAILVNRKGRHVRTLQSYQALSDPEMIGNEKDVYNAIANRKGEYLQKSLEKYIDRMMKRRSG